MNEWGGELLSSRSLLAECDGAGSRTGPTDGGHSKVQSLSVWMESVTLESAGVFGCSGGDLKCTHKDHVDTELQPHLTCTHEVNTVS